MSIREVRAGVWDVQVYQPKRADGVRPRVSRRVFGGRRAAEQVERDFKTFAELHSHGGWSGRKPRLDDYALDEWLADKTDIEPQTRKNYRGALERYIIPALGKLKVADVSVRDVRRLNRTMNVAGLSGSTRRYAFRILSMVMHQAVIDRLIDVSPCEAVKPPKESRTEPQALTADEVRELLRLLAGGPVGMAALVAYDTGMRRGELLALAWADVDLKTGTAQVKHAVEQIGPDVRLKEPKSARSRRAVKLSEPVVAALKTHRAQLNAERLKYQGRIVTDGETSWPMWVDADLVFPSLQYQDAAHPMGRIWTPYAFSKAWRKAIGQANKARLAEHLEAGGEPADFEPWDFGIHRLRHTYATHCLRAGLRDEVVSRALGHSSSSVTRTFYSHVIEGEQAETAAVTGAVIAGDSPFASDSQART
jgi:integrase